MLREFLCVQPLVGRALVIAPVFGAVLVPVGFAVNSYNRSVPWWAVSLVPLGALAAVLLWLVLALLGLLPFTATPWALVPTRLWLDRCCIDQSTPETIEAAFEGLPAILGQCDKMVAFASANYFRDLRCVYELATFCSSHRKDLDSRLLLLSLRWPCSFSPCKRAALTKQERGWLESFACCEARCYKPSDRARLLEKIRQEWGAEERFEAFVQKDLVAIFARSKQRYQTQLVKVASKSLELVLGD